MGAGPESRRVLGLSGLLHCFRWSRQRRSARHRVRRWASFARGEGLRMHFAGWSRPLEAYASALEGAGLAIANRREPVPVARDGNSPQRWTRIPLFLWLKARPFGLT